MNRPALLVLMVALLTGAAAAATVSVNFIPELVVQDLSASHEVNNLTIESNQNVVNGSWVLMGTNDQELFAPLDTRRYVSFSAGVMQQFNFSNTDPYRWYYLYLTDGFNPGSTLTVHFNYSLPVQTPTAQTWTPMNFTLKRQPSVHVVDFSNAPTGFIQNYSITVNQSFVVGASWYLYGTNTTPVIGSSSSASLTLVDAQTAITFTANVPQDFDISTEPPFEYYIFYLQSGFATVGTRMEVRFNSGVPPVPTAAPTPVANVTAVQPSQYTDRTFFYFFGTGAFVLMIGALFVRRSEEIFSGLAAVFALIAAVIGSSVNFSRNFVYLDPATVFENGTAITNGTVVITHTYIVLPNPEVVVVFGVLMVFAVVSTIRFYLNKLGEET
jgi:hypothetical protein